MKEAELLKFIHETEEHYFVEAPKNFKENILIQTNNEDNKDFNRS